MSKGEIMSDILLSALRAHETLHANASSNIANMNTRDYKSIRTTLIESPCGGVSARTERSATEGMPTVDGHCTSNVDLPQEICDMILAQRGFEAVLGAIGVREEMLDDLMNTLSGPGR